MFELELLVSGNKIQDSVTVMQCYAHTPNKGHSHTVLITPKWGVEESLEIDARAS